MNQLVAECLADNVFNIKELTDGFFNTAFQIDLENGKKIVLKVAPPKNIPVMRQEKDIMQTEVAAIRIVAEQTSIPVPEIISYITQSRYIDSAYFIMDYVDGVPLDKILHELTNEEQTQVYEQLGKYIKELHNIHHNKFGYTLNNSCGYSTWSEAFISIIDDVLDDAKNGDISLPIDSSEIHRLVASCSLILDMVTTPTLLHRDLWMGNIFIKRDSLEIAAITDWERSLYGDILMDFVFGFIEGLASFEGRIGFNKEYGRTGKLTKEEKIRIDLYYLYFVLLILVEGYYRGYQRKEQEEKVNIELVKTARKLKFIT